MRPVRIVALLLGFVVLGMSTAARAAPDVTVAVLYFDYEGTSDDMRFLRKGLNQMLVADLVDTPGVAVVERVLLEQILVELDLNRSSKIDRKSAVRVGKLLGAQYLVMGGYFDFREQLHVSIRLVSVSTGEVVGGIRDRRQIDDFWSLEQHLATELTRVIREKIVGPPARGDEGQNTGSAVARAAKKKKKARSSGARPRKPARPAPRARPKKLDARLAARYGRGLDAMDRGDKNAARSHLQAVVKERPDFNLAAVDLASLAK